MNVKLLILAISACAFGRSLNKESTLNRERRAVAYADENLLLPNKTLYYKFASRDLLLVKRIHWAFKEVGANTCVKFVEVTDGSTKQYLTLTLNEAKACGGVGEWTRRAPAFWIYNLKLGCLIPSNLRRMTMYFLGFVNIVNAPDRDKYVTINTTNLPKSMLEDFMVIPNLSHYGAKYDHASVTNFGSKAYAKDPKYRVIVPKDPENLKYFEPDSNIFYSFYDFYSINKAYKCNTHCEADHPACEGYFDNNCNCVKSTDARFQNWPRPEGSAGGWEISLPKQN